MVDHHVDRPEMYVQQCTQLTGTNGPIGLICSSNSKTKRSKAKLKTSAQSARCSCSSSGLVAIATAKHPIPSRTRPLRAVTPMVLRLKTWESRSPPNLTKNNISPSTLKSRTDKNGAGWSSPVARQAHNLKAAGSNPAPATKITALDQYVTGRPKGRLFAFQTAGQQ